MSGVDIRTGITNYLETLGFGIVSSNGTGAFSRYSGVREELESLHSGAGLRIFPSPGIIELRGKDVLDYLHRISTNSLLELQKENIAFTLFTNEKGRIIDKTAVLNFGDYQLLVAAPVNKTKVLSWLNKYIITDDVKTADSSGKYILFELSGPQSDSFSTLLCSDAACKLNPNTFRVINTEGILFFIMKVKDVSGPVKYWLLADPDNGLKLLKFMIDNKGPFDFNLIGEEAYNIYRIENGIPAAPNELNDNYNPHEAGLMELVSTTKGCYIGQEVIARLDTYDKVQRHLRSVRFIQEPEQPGEFLLLNEDNAEVGNITSTAYSHRLKASAGLAYIRKLSADPGKILTARDKEGRTYPVTVSELPSRK